VVRLLTALDEPITGVAIAGEVGVTQPRVSQVLAQLRNRGAETDTRPPTVSARPSLTESSRGPRDPE
jgi:DNA-binding MarR family transcriptional regulator